jgi:PHD/YefM family antitoxin component YafN of YafNO toxin-antitoxin module
MSATPPAVEINDIPDVLEHVMRDKDRAILIRDGKKVAAVVPLEDLETLEELDDLLEQEEIEAARKEAREQGTVAWEAIKRELGL